MKSWGPATLNQYNVYLKKWIQFCRGKKLEPLERNIVEGLEFLRKLFNKGNSSYSAISSARSALSCIFDKPPFGEEPMVIRFMKSVHNTKPSRPRYNQTWDVSRVLRFLEKWSPGRFLSRRQLTLKLATLLTLVTGQRIQTIHALDINTCVIDDKCATFTIEKRLKHHSARNKLNQQIHIPKYNKNKKICPVVCLQQYLKRTKMGRKDSQLFIGIQRPYKAISKSTISRWVKSTLTYAGIDTGRYKTHSTRAAATTAAAKAIDISLILKAAGWTRAATFGTFYNKRIEDNRTVFGEAVLNTA